MKTILIVFAATLLSAVTSLACPNLAGTYSTQNSYGTVNIVTTQSTCQSIDFVVTFIAPNGTTSALHYFVTTDGIMRKVGSPNGIDEYMAMHYDGNQLYSLAVWAQNGSPSPVVTSSTDIFSLDETGNLVDHITSVDGVGATAVNQVVYTRQH